MMDQNQRFDIELRWNLLKQLLESSLGIERDEQTNERRKGSGFSKPIKNLIEKHKIDYLPESKSVESLAECYKNWCDKKHEPTILNNRSAFLEHLLFVEAFRFKITGKEGVYAIEGNDFPDKFDNNILTILRKFCFDKLNVTEPNEFFIKVAMKIGNDSSSIYKTYHDLCNNKELREVMYLKSPAENDQYNRFTKDIEENFKEIKKLGTRNDCREDNMDKIVSAFQFAYRYSGVFSRVRQTKFYIWGLLLRKWDDPEKYAFQNLLECFRNSVMPTLDDVTLLPENVYANLSGKELEKVESEDGHIFFIEDFQENASIDISLPNDFLTVNKVKALIHDDYNKLRAEFQKKLENPKPEFFITEYKLENTEELICKFTNTKLLAGLKPFNYPALYDCDNEIEKNEKIKDKINKIESKLEPKQKKALSKILKEEKKLLQEIEPLRFIEKLRQRLIEDKKAKKKKYNETFFTQYPGLNDIVYQFRIFTILKQTSPRIILKDVYENINLRNRCTEIQAYPDENYLKSVKDMFNLIWELIITKTFKKLHISDADIHVDDSLAEKFSNKLYKDGLSNILSNIIKDGDSDFEEEFEKLYLKCKEQSSDIAMLLFRKNTKAMFAHLKKEIFSKEENSESYSHVFNFASIQFFLESEVSLKHLNADERSELLLQIKKIEEMQKQIDCISFSRKYADNRVEKNKYKESDHQETKPSEAEVELYNKNNKLVKLFCKMSEEQHERIVQMITDELLKFCPFEICDGPLIVDDEKAGVDVYGVDQNRLYFDKIVTKERMILILMDRVCIDDIGKDIFPNTWPDFDEKAMRDIKELRKVILKHFNGILKLCGYSNLNQNMHTDKFFISTLYKMKYPDFLPSNMSEEKKKSYHPFRQYLIEYNRKPMFEQEQATPQDLVLQKEN